jgi:hypothetical protein
MSVHLASLTTSLSRRHSEVVNSGHRGRITRARIFGEKSETLFRYISIGIWYVHPKILLEDIAMRTSIALAAVLFWGFAATFVTDAQSRRRAEFSDWSAPVNIGAPINGPSDDNVPVLTKDENTLYFTSNRTGSIASSEDIWVSHRRNKNSRWEEPVNIGPTINTGAMERIRSITEDGRVLLFQSNRTGGSGGTDVWATVRKHINDDFSWSEPVNLGPVINTQANEVAAKYLFDERHRNGNLFFSSGRAGGFGGPDIYESEITESGFAPPVNIVELNTASIEACFWVRRDGLEIIFSTNRPNLTEDITMYDLWVSTRSSVYENWSPPESLGPIVNSVGYLDVNPMLADADSKLYFSSSRPNSHGPAGNMDIYLSTRTRLR